jgi:hypothetical protein
MSRSPQDDCPADVLGWIPWYPDGLEEDQRGAVEAHAAACSACRDEISVLLGSTPTEATPDPERIYAQVLARMESGEADQKQATQGSGATVSRLPLRDRSEQAPPKQEQEQDPDEPLALSWRRVSASSSMRRVALAAGLLLALAIGALVGPPILAPEATDEPVYETASASDRLGETDGSTGAVGSPDPQAGMSLEIVFREDAPASRINQTLRTLGARITSGPSQLGVYRLELGAGVDLTAAKKLLTEDRDGVATFAEKPLRP